MLWVLIRGTSNEYPQHMLLWRNKKNIMWISPLICSNEYSQHVSTAKFKKHLCGYPCLSGALLIPSYLELFVMNPCSTMLRPNKKMCV